MTYAQKIRMALAYKKISEAELSRLIGTSPQAFNQRMKTDKFSAEDMQTIAAAIGATFDFYITFSDGTKV